MLLVSRLGFEKATIELFGEVTGERLLHMVDHDFLRSLKFLTDLLKGRRTPPGQTQKAQLCQFLLYTYSGQNSYFRMSLEGSSDKIRVIDSAIHFAYKIVFEPFCDQILREGSSDVSALEDVCYVFWDLPCGLKSCFFIDSTIAESRAFFWLEYLLSIDHVTIQESVICGLRSLMHTHQSRADALLRIACNKFIEGHPLHTYAESGRLRT